MIKSITEGLVFVISKDVKDVHLELNKLKMKQAQVQIENFLRKTFIEGIITNKEFVSIANIVG